MFDNLPTNNNNSKASQGENSDSGQLSKKNMDPNAAFYPQQPPKQNIQASSLNQTVQSNANNFDNQITAEKSQKPKIEQIAPKPVEDIFSETNSQEKPAIFQPKTEAPPIVQSPEVNASQIDPYTGERINNKNKTIVFALMLISLMLVAMIGWYAYRMFFSSINPTIVEPTIKPQSEMIIDESDIQENTSLDLPSDNTKDSDAIEVLDSDGDGLSDDEEARLGTNYLIADTDGDGLFDREEVKVYKTDPLNTDSDKDGYADGIEVEGGYNPNGEGKLYSLED